MHTQNPSIRLVCLDFDGTAVDYDADRTFVHSAVIDLLNELQDQGVSWCVNSGRAVEDQRRIIRLSQDKGLRHLPSALICGESFIYVVENGEYVSSEPWNSQTWAHLGRFHKDVQRVLETRMDDWRARFTPDVRMGDGYTVFCLADEDGMVERFATELAEALAGVRHVEITRNGGWVVVLPEQLGKGNVLRQYYARIDGSADTTLAIGDHLNDLSMLDGTAAKWVGCPADAERKVIETVRSAGGRVATVAGPEGTVEIVRFFLCAGQNGRS